MPAAFRFAWPSSVFPACQQNHPIDPGDLSRILARFKADGLLVPRALTPA
jgi:hypothetical protein